MRSTRFLSTAVAAFALSLTWAAHGALAEEAAATDFNAHGGLGLITLEGPTGMFLNPTSGIVSKGAFAVESCMSFRENAGDHAQANAVLGVYGLTEWLEVGATGLIVHGLDPAVVGSEEIGSGQVNTRARLVKDRDGMPEVSVGAIAAWGDDPLTHQSLYLAASKGFAFGDGHVFTGIRLHGGVRNTWQELGDDVTTAYAGIEIGLTRDLYLISEINTKDDSNINTPYSVGVQYRGNGFGFSAAYLQPGDTTDPSAYVGIGVSY